MLIRHSTPADLPRMLAIYEEARAFMARTGNPNQWGPNRWPPESLLVSDIAAGKSYICLDDQSRVSGVFFFDMGQDIEPTYLDIENGSWLSDTPYGVVHRIASGHSVPGVGTYCLRWAMTRCPHIRIDTHPDNRVMQNLLAKLGFSHRGTIYVHEDRDPRMAFEIITPRPAVDHGAKARALFMEGYNCAQAVFCAFTDVTGLGTDTAARLSSSFGGGMGRMREVCGAVSAACMVLGLTRGCSDPRDHEAKKSHYALVRRFCEAFRQQEGDIHCRALLERAGLTDSLTPGGDPEERTPDYYQKRPCPAIVERAAMLLEQMI